MKDSNFCGRIDSTGNKSNRYNTNSLTQTKNWTDVIYMYSNIACIRITRLRQTRIKRLQGMNGLFGGHWTLTVCRDVKMRWTWFIDSRDQWRRYHDSIMYVPHLWTSHIRNPIFINRSISVEQVEPRVEPNNRVYSFLSKLITNHSCHQHSTAYPTNADWQNYNRYSYEQCEGKKHLYSTPAYCS